mgnify:CR=1 FL=1
MDVRVIVTFVIVAFEVELYWRIAVTFDAFENSVIFAVTVTCTLGSRSAVAFGEVLREVTMGAVRSVTVKLISVLLEPPTSSLTVMLQLAAPASKTELFTVRFAHEELPESVCVEVAE